MFPPFLGFFDPIGDRSGRALVLRLDLYELKRLPLAPHPCDVVTDFVVACVVAH
jgi:hypothetical protein